MNEGIDQIDPKIVKVLQNFLAYQTIEAPLEEFISPTAKIDFFNNIMGKWEVITGAERISRWKMGGDKTDFKAEIQGILQSGQYFTVEWTNTGSYGITEWYDVDHHSNFEIRNISIIKIEDNKVVECRSVYDTWEVMKFVGRATLKSNDSIAIQKYMEILKKAGFLEFDKNA